MSERNDGREANGSFAVGNRIWSTRSSAGAKRKFETAEDLQQAVDEYIDWVEVNPVITRKVAPGKGVVEIPLNRPPTIQGFCAHFRMGLSTWHAWADANHPRYRPDLVEVIEEAETLFTADHIDGGMVGDYNSNLTARITGLTDKSETDHTTKGEKLPAATTLDLSNVPTEALVALKAAKDASESE